MCAIGPRYIIDDVLVRWGSGAEALNASTSIGLPWGHPDADELEMQLQAVGGAEGGVTLKLYEGGTENNSRLRNVAGGHPQIVAPPPSTRKITTGQIHWCKVESAVASEVVAVFRLYGRKKQTEGGCGKGCGGCGK